MWDVLQCQSNPISRSTRAVRGYTRVIFQTSLSSNKNNKTLLNWPRHNFHPGHWCACQEDTAVSLQPSHGLSKKSGDRPHDVCLVTDHLRSSHAEPHTKKIGSGLCKPSSTVVSQPTPYHGGTQGPRALSRLLRPCRGLVSLLGGSTCWHRNTSCGLFRQAGDGLENSVQSVRE